MGVAETEKKIEATQHKSHIGPQTIQAAHPDINVNIERVVLEGIDLPAEQWPILQAAIEEELGNILAVSGVAPQSAAIAIPSVPATSLALNEQSNPIVLGRRIAHAIYTGIGYAAASFPE